MTKFELLLLLLYLGLSLSRRCVKSCSRSFLPVCGEREEGQQDFSNMCELRRASCESGLSIRFVGFGKCEEVKLPKALGVFRVERPAPSDLSVKASPDVSSPSSPPEDEKSTEEDTGGSQEEAESEDVSEEEAISDLPSLSSSLVRQRVGLGSMGCDRKCVKKAEPVCGSDGVTYQNSCALRLAQCEDPSLEKVQEGACPEATKTTVSDSPCEYDCPDEVSPVCSSEGETFANSCLFALAQCANPFVDMEHEGECSTLPRVSSAALPQDPLP